MIKRLCGIIAICLLTNTAVFAAGGKDRSATETETAKPVTLRFSWLGSDPRHQATLAAIDRYQELHPHITIEGEYQGNNGYNQKVMTQVAGGTEPDLIQLDYINFPGYAGRSDLFADLTTLKSIDLSPYPPSILSEYCSINGKIISLPMGTNGYGIMINKTFFAKHNIPFDTAWTWEKMVEIGGRIHRSNPDDYLVAFDSNAINTFMLTAYIYSKTGKYWTSDATLSVEVSKNDMVDAFTMLKRLFDSGAAQPIGETSLFTNLQEQSPRWQNGGLGFIPGWSGTIEKYKDALKPGNFAVGKPPFAESDKNQRVWTKPSMVLAISNRKPHITEAAEFANWFLNDPDAVRILETQRSIPTNQKAFDLLNNANSIGPEVAAMVSWANTNPASPPPLAEENGEIKSMVQDLCEQVAYNRLTPDAAADRFLADVQARLNTLKPATSP
jgi:oligogalacturonide transport system substrate-binding protein